MRPHPFVSAFICALASHLSCLSTAFAQTYPDKPIRFIVPFAPGGSTDFLARAVGQKMTETWQQPVIIDNRPGAGGTIGADLASKAAPDGYTIVLSAMSHATAVGFYRKLPYDLTADLQAVSLFATQPNVLVTHPSIPAKSLQDLIALARARPGQLAFSSAGNGSTQHLMGELFKSLARVQIIHVPYKGTAPALTDLISGQVSLSFQPVITAMPNAKARRLRALALTGSKRSPAAPGVPTMIEAGLANYDVVAWYGVHAPARTPRAAVDTLSREINRILGLPDIRERLLSQGLDPAANTPEQFGAMVKTEVAKWAKVIQESGIKFD